MAKNLHEVELPKAESPEAYLIEQLKRANRLYAVISNVNQMILHIKDQEKIFTEACRIAVEEGKFKMAWIGLPDPQTETIKPKCWAGHEEGYLSAIHTISAKDVPGGRGPTGTALREKKTVVASDFKTDPRLVLWRDEATKRGYASSIALPIFTSNRSIGTFTLYASEPNFFNKTEVRLLEDMTANIAFALETIENDRIRKKAELEVLARTEDLSKVHARYVSFLENMKEGLHLIDFNFRYLFANNASIKQSRLKKEELIGHSLFECYPGIEHSEFFSKLKTCMEERVPMTFEYQHEFPDAQKQWFEVHLSPTPEGVLFLVLDIEERKKISTELMKANKAREEEKLFSASKMAALGEMASGIAHEVNNPLSIIVMKISQLRRKYEEHSLTEEELEDGLKKVAATAQRIGSVVKGLSNISRNAENDPMKKVNVASILEDTLQLCRERFKSNLIELKTDICAIEKIEIEAKAPQIMQVLLNLLNNAFDATSNLPVKWISVQAYPTDTGVEISVMDSGKGIPDHLLGKIMQPFFTTKDPGKGTGLGLSISKGIIEEHQGQFYYRRNSPHTCFVVELPYAQKN